MEQLKKIQQFYKDHKRMPSYAEISKLIGFKSKNAGVKLARKLMSENFLRKDGTGRLLPGRLFYSVRFLGAVKAGWPSPAEEETSDTMSLDDYLIGNKEATFMLKASGDSMIGEGIKDGDMVLVERGGTPKDGDIVVALIDNETTVKYFRKRGGKTYLEAANKKYPPFYPEGELIVQAIVKAVIRKY